MAKTVGKASNSQFGDQLSESGELEETESKTKLKANWLYHHISHITLHLELLGKCFLQKRYPISASTAQHNCDLHGLEVSPSHCRTCLAVHPAYLGPGGNCSVKREFERRELYSLYMQEVGKSSNDSNDCSLLQSAIPFVLWRSISIKKCPHLPTSLHCVLFVNKEVLMSLLSSFSSGNGLFIKACFLQNVQPQLVWHFWNV